MASRRNANKDKNVKSKMMNFGIMDVDNISSLDEMNKLYGVGGMDDEDEADLEAELLRLQEEDGFHPPVPRKSAPTQRTQHKDYSLGDISKMTEVALAGDSEEDDDEDLENDPSLLAELEEFIGADNTDDHHLSTPEPPVRTRSPQHTGVAIPGGQLSELEERRDMYRTALTNSKSVNDISKTRRLDRGLKTLDGLIKQVKTGKQIDDTEIPPPVGLGVSSESSNPPESFTTPTSTPTKPTVAPTRSAAPPTQPSPKHTGLTYDPVQHDLLTQRQSQYKQAALNAKRSGNIQRAKELISTAKVFDKVIAAYESGQPVDISAMPPPPTQQEIHSNPSTVKQHQEERSIQQGASPSNSLTPITNPGPSPCQQPTTILEALIERRGKYQTAKTQAQSEDNSSKLRRMDRIVKQYDSAIKSNKFGKAFDYEELPTPPGFPPLPVEGRPSPQQPTTTVSPKQPVSVSPPKPIAPPRSQGKSATPSSATLTRNQRQLQFLLDRQKQYKDSAITSKRQGDIEEAKRLLRICKGFDSMIEASQNGLPVDIIKVPPSLIKTDDFQFVDHHVLDTSSDKDKKLAEIYERLQDTLNAQIKECNSNSEQYTKLGDVANTSRADKLASQCKADLDSVRMAFLRGDPPPSFRFEQRTFHIPSCNADLTDYDMVVKIIRGINYRIPSDYKDVKDIDTYVKVELAYPSDDTQTLRTTTVKGTISPEYNETVNLKIDRKQRSFQRAVKRLVLKLEVNYERGFLRSDKCLGTVSIKLADLEKKCTLHTCTDLMEGRRTCVGKLEVKLMIREPFLGTELEEVQRKWLVIGGGGGVSHLPSSTSKSVSQGNK